MSDIPYPKFPTQRGYMTESTQGAYIAWAIKQGLLPKDALKQSHIMSLTASDDPDTPIQFWQLFSQLGADAIVDIVAAFYERVFAQEKWFVSVFANVGPLNHHINTQASMWADVMGGGPYYHGAEFRLSFHHTHNAMALMNDRGAALWVKLMVETLDSVEVLQGADQRLRTSINTFLTHFLEKYADDFGLGDVGAFGLTNPALR